MNTSTSTLLAAFVLALSTATASANLIGSDDFNDNSKDPTKWGTDNGNGNNFLTETNQRLEYTKTTILDGFLLRPWIRNTGSYVQNWEAWMDVHVSATSLPLDGDDLHIALLVSSGASSAGVQLNIKNNLGIPIRIFKWESEGPGGGGSSAATLATDGAVRVTFDAASKTLGFYYDDNGSVGGYAWTQFGSVDVDAVATDWGLTNASAFEISMLGESEGILVGSGQAHADNFNLVSEPALDFRIISLEPTGAAAWTLVWTAEVGSLYRVQTSTELATGTWTDVTGDIAAATTYVAHEVTDPTPTGLRRFWRVRKLP